MTESKSSVYFIKTDVTNLDLSNISSELVRVALFKTIEEHLKSNRYQIDVSSATRKGDYNFSGIIYRISFSRENERENGNATTSSIILKIAPENLARRTQFHARAAFTREIFTYDKILPIFRDFEVSKGVNIDKDGFSEYAKCYRTIDIDNNECLLLEDLCIRGFTTIDRRNTEITAEHVRIYLGVLAKFHAISFALKDQRPEKFNELSSNLSEVFISKANNTLRMCLNNQASIVFEAVNAEKNLLFKVKEFYENEAIDTAVDCIDVDRSGSASVIAYGDAWQNNVMFRYDCRGKPIEANFLDWQAVRHSSPVIDIAFFIFCCTTKKIRDVHYDEFLKLYHHNLSTHIRKLGSEPEKLFPYELMLTHFQKCAKYGFIMSTVILPVLTSDNEYRLDLDEIGKRVEDGTIDSENCLISDRSREMLYKRLRDIVDDMVRLEYI